MNHVQDWEQVIREVTWALLIVAIVGLSLWTAVRINEVSMSKWTADQQHRADIALLELEMGEYPRSSRPYKRY